MTPAAHHLHPGTPTVSLSEGAGGWGQTAKLSPGLRQLGCPTGARPSWLLLGPTIQPLSSAAGPAAPGNRSSCSLVKCFSSSDQAGREGVDWLTLAPIHTFQGQTAFIERPLVGGLRASGVQRCARAHPSPIFPLRKQTPAGSVEAGPGSRDKEETGRRRVRGTECEDATKAERVWPGKQDKGTLRAPPTHCCWSPGPRTSPSSRLSPGHHARSGRSGRQDRSR